MKNLSTGHTFAVGLVLGALAVASLGFAIARAADSSNAALADRVQRLEDRAAIEELLVAYGHDLDKRDFPAYASLFATHGSWSGSIGTFTGPAAIQAAMEKAFKRSPGSPVPPTFHLMTNFSVDVHGDGATASSKWTFFRVVKGAPVPTLAGIYEDSLVREGGKWKFLRRVAPAAQSAGK